jgi:hypothetical protein
MTKTIRILCLVISILFCLSTRTDAQPPVSPSPLPVFFNGITLENLDSPLKGQPPVSQVITRVGQITTPIVVRVVFQGGVSPDAYVAPLRQLQSLNVGDTRRVYVMGLLFDSQALRKYKTDDKSSLDCPTPNSAPQKYSEFRYQNRVDCYVDQLDDFVDIWEVGNEVNGAWATEGEKTVWKINYAIKKVNEKNASTGKNKLKALTLVHQPHCTVQDSRGRGIDWDCRSEAPEDHDDMFDWADEYLLKPGSQFRQSEIKYLLVSYYEDNCDKGFCTINPQKPGESKTGEQRLNDYWNDIFNKLAARFNEIKNFGFGEIGYSDQSKTCKPGKVQGQDNRLFYCHPDDPPRSKIYLMNKYHSLNLMPPAASDWHYVGGHFWWNAQEDIFYDPFFDALKAQFKPVR